MTWSPITTSGQAAWRLAPSHPPPRCELPTVFSFVPEQVRRLYEAFCQSNEEVYPVVAWSAESLEPNPNLVPTLLGLVIVCLGTLLLFSLSGPWCAACLQVAADVAWALASIIRHPFKSLRRRRDTYASDFIRAYEIYRDTLEKFINMAKMCRSLQGELKNKNTRIDHQESILASLTYDLEQSCLQNGQLESSRESLRQDKARLKERLREERVKHADDLLAFQQDLQTLLRQVEVLKAEKLATQAKHEEELKMLRTENVSLQAQLRGTRSPQRTCDHLPVINELNERLATTEASLQQTAEENALLKQELAEQQQTQTRRQNNQSRKYAQQQASFVEALEKFRYQLVDQQEEHIKQQDVLAQRIALAKADKTRIKAKLKNARADADAKSQDVARLQDALYERERQLALQSESFEQDLHFVFVESHFERQRYKGELSHAQAQSIALRQQLADLFNQYRAKSSRLNETEAGLQSVEEQQSMLANRLEIALAEKMVSGHLEDMLSEEIRRRNEEYETLEISFDVLESAYGFLAAETVRLEHELEEERRANGKILAPEPEEIEIITDNEAEDQGQVMHSVPATFDMSAAATTATVITSTPARQRVSSALSIASTSSSRSVSSPSPAYHRRPISSASSLTFSERSWPATPGLTLDTTSSRSTPTSPTLATPPLPPLFLPTFSSSPREDAACGPPSERRRHGVDDDDPFSSWTLDDLPPPSPLSPDT